ncbi:MAG: RpiB/LacA/LacB family sugar-phosphate isomerase [Acidilobaceae archaeon]
MSVVAVGSDDLYPAAKAVVEYLAQKGFQIKKFGSLATGRPESWVKVALEVAEAVARGEAKWGVLVCYTGTGVSIAANKVKGVRAALCNDPTTARGARLWNDANVLSMSGRLVTEILAREIIDSWLSVSSIDESERENIEYLKRYDEERCKERASD